jgi:sulfate/thiosulfate transport system substrate-binding protein
VAVVDKVVDRKHTRKEAEAYLQWLWSDDGQEIAARHHLRPRNAKVLAAHARDFPKVETFTVDDLFGNWKLAQKTHFDDGGTYDQIMATAHRQ